MILILLIKVVHQPKIVRKFDQFWISFFEFFLASSRIKPKSEEVEISLYTNREGIVLFACYCRVFSQPRVTKLRG